MVHKRQKLCIFLSSSEMGCVGSLRVTPWRSKPVGHPHDGQRVPQFVGDEIDHADALTLGFEPRGHIAVHRDRADNLAISVTQGRRSDVEL